MLNLKTIILASLFSVAAMANDTDYLDSLFEKWGTKYSVGAPILKSLSDFFTKKDPSFSLDIGMGYKAVGVMGIEDSVLENTSFKFLKGVTPSQLKESSLNIRTGAAMLGECVKQYKKTPMAIRCYSEYIAEDEAVRLAKLFPKAKKASILDN